MFEELANSSEITNINILMLTLKLVIYQQSAQASVSGGSRGGGLGGL